MAMIRCKVIGANEVSGVATGGEVELDDELINVAALAEGGHVEIIDAELNVEEQTLGAEPVPAVAPPVAPAPGLSAPGAPVAVAE